MGNAKVPQPVAHRKKHNPITQHVRRALFGVLRQSREDSGNGKVFVEQADKKVSSLFSSILSTPPGFVVMHSSFSRLMPPPGFESALLDLIAEYAEKGWTWAFPAFTFSFCEGKPFHLGKSHSETGVAADLILARIPGAVRTKHPVYSFVAVGPGAEKLLACESSTSFGDDSPFGLFERENAWLVALGCGVEYLTQCHRAEVRASVPYRLHRNFSGQADWNDGQGMRPVMTNLFVRDWQINPMTSWRIAYERLRAEGGALEFDLWRGQVQVARAKALAAVCDRMLADDPLAMVVNRSEVESRVRKGGAGNGHARLDVALLGLGNTHLVRRALEENLNRLVTNRDWRVYSSPYGQLMQQLRLGDSDLARLRPNISILCDRLEDVLGRLTLRGAPPAGALEKVRDYADAAAEWTSRNDGWLIVTRFAPLDAGADEETLFLFDRANAILRERLSCERKVLWVDPANLAAAAGERAVDARLRFMGRFGYSERMSALLAGKWAAIVAALTGNSVRAVVVDLDNTLWGGVLGEDGVSGLAVGGDYPGNAYREFQSVLKSLKDGGMLLAACSKNDAEHALAAMDFLPDMLIRSSDLSAHRLGWRPKWEYVKEIAGELNLGLSSLLFVDDNHIERDLMRRALPEVRVLDLPSDPAGFADALLACPWLEMVGTSAEDNLRAGNMAAKKRIDGERAEAVDLEAFYAGLDLRLHLNPLSEANAARAEQLSQKTNQFNATTRRHTRRELLAMAKAGADVVVLGVEDKYSAFEHMGLLVLKQDPGNPETGVIDSYLLSCRVLGRGLEVPVVTWALGRAADRGWSRLEAAVIETERNMPVRGVFAAAGMAAAGDGVWSSPASPVLPLPAWLKMEDNISMNGGVRTGARDGDNHDAVLLAERRVCRLLSKILGIVDDDRMKSAAMGRTSGWDSLKQIEVVLALENEFETVFQSSDIMGVTNVPGIVSFLVRKEQRKHANDAKEK